MNKLTNAIPCSECEYAIYLPRDPFTGKPRWLCGSGIELVDAFGDMELACDINVGGCEFGKRKEKNEQESNRNNFILPE